MLLWIWFPFSVMLFSSNRSEKVIYIIEHVLIHNTCYLQHFEGGTEPQNGCGWKGRLEVILSNPATQAGSPRADFPGPHPDGF